jgi:putative salt-induced outer membrane protein
MMMAAATLAVSTAAWAQAPETPEKPWSAELGIGIVITDGNSDTSSVNGSGEVMYQQGQWRHSGRAEAFRSSTEGEKTAERYLVTGKSDYRLDDRNYLFGLLGYEDDRFSGYDYQGTGSVGYGRDVLRGPTVNAFVEAGVGARYYRVTDAGDSESEGTIRLAGALNWNISDTATFGQEVDTTIGEEFTVTNSITSLSTQVVGNLAAKMSLHIRHISDVPPDTEKRDTKLTANLVYSF